MLSPPPAVWLPCRRVGRPRPGRGVRLALLAALVAWPALAQEAVESPPAAEEASTAAETEEPAKAAEPAGPSKPMGPEDPYNRGTPRGSVYGFMQASGEGDFEKAASFLDLRRLPSHRWERDGPKLARELKTVIDQTLVVDYQNLTDTNEGIPSDGLPAWQDRLGRITTRDGSAEILLQRVPRAEDGVRIWKVAAATVERVPALYDEFGFGLLEQYLPPVFFEVQLFDLDLWRWVAVVTAAFLAWLLSWLLATVAVKVLGGITARTRSALDDRVVHLVRNPVRIVLGVLIFHVGTLPLGLPLSVRERLGGIEQALVVVAVAWLLLQLVDLAALTMQQRILRNGDPGTAALVSPGKRTIRALIVVLASLFLLDNLGFNVAALIAGLGVGGIAVALAAQKTVENLFGGVTLLADRPVRVGDFCRFGDKIGTVEEIGLRSTRVRTLDRTLVTIPNAEFSALQLENFAARDRIRLFAMLGLRYETTPEQLRYVLARLREMLLGHPKIDPDPARVRFVGFGAYSLDLELFAYARTSDWNEFLQIREDVFLRIIDIVDEAGTGFAFPSSTTYVGRDDGLDPERSRAAEQHVGTWREAGELPFPEFAQQRRAELEDKLDWPPEGSPGRPPARDRPTRGNDEG